MSDPLPTLSAAEVRVLGSLIEKQITTPDNYPLSLNSLTNACNQLTNRDPVVVYDDQTVVAAIDALRDQRLATLFHGAESRVAKYRHSLQDTLPLPSAEVAVLCVLLLRGPQTVGELRTRTERLHAFESLADVEAALQQLVTHVPPLVTKLPRQPGTKESRYAHLLAGAPEPAIERSTAPLPSATPVVPTPPSELERVTRLEAEVADLRQQVTFLTEQLAEVRKGMRE